MKNQHITHLVKKLFTALMLMAVTFSCTLNASLQDDELKQDGIKNIPSRAGASNYLHKVDLYLEKGALAKGRIQVSLATVNGTQLAISHRDITSIRTGWNSFTFTNVPLRSGQPYMIRVSRDLQIGGGEQGHVKWGGIKGDEYPWGVSDMTSWDYAFRTQVFLGQVGGTLVMDQRQTQVSTSYHLVTTTPLRWQIFLPM